jgi:hypothetical protein
VILVRKATRKYERTVWPERSKQFANKLWATYEEIRRHETALQDRNRKPNKMQDTSGSPRDHAIPAVKLRRQRLFFHGLGLSCIPMQYAAVEEYDQNATNEWNERGYTRDHLKNSRSRKDSS